MSNSIKNVKLEKECQTQERRCDNKEKECQNPRNK